MELKNFKTHTKLNGSNLYSISHPEKHTSCIIILNANVTLNTMIKQAKSFRCRVGEISYYTRMQFSMKELSGKYEIWQHKYTVYHVVVSKLALKVLNLCSQAFSSAVDTKHQRIINEELYAVIYKA